jgi:hypothetical protein
VVEFQSVPVIDIAASSAAGAIGEACRESGFFYVVGHGVDFALLGRLEGLSREFFGQARAEKLAIRMELGGRAWRGYFPVGDELTSGSPDQKEGIYFGAELEASHPKVVAGTPLHGANLFPDGVPGFRETVLEHIDAMTELGHRIMEAVALSLDLDAEYFSRLYTRDPLILFRIFNYPALSQATTPLWRVDRRAADPRCVRLQHWRHARSDDRRTVPIDAASSPECERTRPLVVSVLLRPELGRRSAPDRAREKRRRRQGRTVGPNQRS